MIPKALSVSQFILGVKDLLEGNFQNVVIEGEISNFSFSPSGHYYFSLIDEDSLLSVALFKFDAIKNPVLKTLKNGDKVICVGNVSVYAKKGQFQLIAKRIFNSGKGDLKAQFEFLKRKLANEGLFDQDRKRPIPKFPKKVAIITAPNGAALSDFITVLQRRTKAIEVLVIPSLVQGLEAPIQLINSLKKAYDFPSIDLIILARGGGSSEDLFAFNDENLVRKISESTVPVISAIGHEVDFSLCDFVSDFRAETPTAAAEIISEHYFKVKERLTYLGKNLINSQNQQLLKFKNRLQGVHPRSLFQKISAPYIRLREKLQRLNPIPLVDRLFNFNEKKMYLDDQLNRMIQNSLMQVNERKLVLKKNQELLLAMNPQNVMKRGYSYVTNKDKKVIFSKKEIKENQNLELNFYDGKVNITVIQE